MALLGHHQSERTPTENPASRQIRELNLLRAVHPGGVTALASKQEGLDPLHGDREDRVGATLRLLDLTNTLIEGFAHRRISNLQVAAAVTDCA